MTDYDNFNVSKQDWETTFDAITDFVSVLDKDFRIVKVNRALAEFLKKSPGELEGTHCYEVMHDRTSHWDGCPHEQMMRDKKAVTLEVDDPFIGVPLLVTASPILNSKGELVGSVHVAKDVSSLKGMREDLAIKHQQLQVLNNLSRKAIRNNRLDDVIVAALDGIQQACSPDLILYYMRSGEWLVLRGVYPEDAEDLNEKKKVGTCLCGLAGEKGVPVFSRNIKGDERCTLNECKRAGFHSFAALPLIQQDGTIFGVVGMASKTERDFSSEQPFLEILSGTVGVVSQNALLIEELEKQSGMLEENVRERTRELEERNNDLERFNKLFVDREFRIKELRDQVAELQSDKGATGNV